MNPRLDNLISWVAASVVATAGVLFVLKRQEDQGTPTPVRVLPRATPAQEPLGLQELRAHRTRPRQEGARALANSVARVAGHRLSYLPRDAG
jgi:hypothetical protein